MQLRAEKMHDKSLGFRSIIGSMQMFALGNGVPCKLSLMKPAQLRQRLSSILKHHAVSCSKFKCKTVYKMLRAGSNIACKVISNKLSTKMTLEVGCSI
jgi:hypothetical protein